MGKTLIAGVGNVLRSDDGIGPAIIAAFKKQAYSFQDCDFVDFGIDGFSLLDKASEYKDIIIIDAVNMRNNPGTIRVFNQHEAKIEIHSDALSTHGFGIAEILALSERLSCKAKYTIVGIQPQSISFGESLSPKIASKTDEIVDIIKKLIQK